MNASAEATGTVAAAELAAWLERAGRGPRGRAAPAATGGPPLADLFGDDGLEDDLFGGPDDFLDASAPARVDEDPFAAIEPLGALLDDTEPQSAALGPDALATLEGDGRLDHADATVAAQVLAWMAASPPSPLRDGGALGRLLVAALRGESVPLAVQAAREAHRRGAQTLQVEVARLLDRHAELGHADIEAVLDATEALADGRVVRAMEATLAAHGGALGRHQAWRARHIIQSIRRSGRR